MKTAHVLFATLLVQSGAIGRQTAMDDDLDLVTPKTEAKASLIEEHQQKQEAMGVCDQGPGCQWRFEGGKFKGYKLPLEPRGVNPSLWTDEGQKTWAPGETLQVSSSGAAFVLKNDCMLTAAEKAATKAYNAFCGQPQNWEPGDEAMFVFKKLGAGPISDQVLALHKAGAQKLKELKYWDDKEMEVGEMLSLKQRPPAPQVQAATSETFGRDWSQDEKECAANDIVVVQVGYKKELQGTLVGNGFYWCPKSPELDLGGGSAHASLIE